MKIKSKTLAYDGKKYFESWHRSVINKEFSDRVTISPTFSELGTKYHYNAVENLLIEYFYDTEVVDNPHVFDIGSGAGHWIEFYKTYFNSAYSLGVEISEPCYDMLVKKFEQDESVDFMLGDVSSTDFKLDKKFDIINAIGVIFHIVDDAAWYVAMNNLMKLLNKGGVIIVGGEFGDKTYNAQFNKTNDFDTWDERQKAWDEFHNTEDESVFVNKRLRSIADWEKCAKENNLKIKEIVKQNISKLIQTPQNNILILTKVD
ncbi:MAG: class I SAM-dependent methyltransferase [Bacteroidetes bacterium]|jgi:SAM-dependent methyltransferase|nr:class I SAM-dependent methyltransferase [Bacteroidota bacterium]MBT3932872.1 class I SAM-dependent methyltransferase [Bacteroidota bacterium]MBT4970906.1 class I SAM-dependent methyltransferase [Bacteroidota bacterium]MBT7826941.1 class I SAM-dependent methyltransferase [Bacteroidota bacterium]